MSAGPAVEGNAHVRLPELAAGLAEVQGRIDAACASAGRQASEVTIVAITKTWPVSDVRLLAHLGIRHMGENRVAEARAKVDECRGLDLVWHFVGQVQRNKAGAVATFADVVESVDRAPLVSALDGAAARADRRLGVCVQVSLDPEDLSGPSGPGGRGGASVGEVPALADLVARATHLDLLGLMAVAPLGADPRDAFARLAGIRADLLGEHPGATMLSAGMSGDLEAAIAAGATHVRLGSALLGHRTPLK